MTVEPVQIGPCTLYCGDCLDILPTLAAGSVDAVVTDPPYGINYNPRRSQSSSASGTRKSLDRVYGDNEEFDPSFLLGVAEQFVIWGANNFAHKLPPSKGWLIWDKRDGGSLFRGFIMSDAELAWCNTQGRVHTLSQRWCGHLRDTDAGERRMFVHPTQKSIAVMEWSLSFVGGDVILDPFMGSGTTGVACVRTGRRFIGIEKEPKYFEIACKRISEAVNATPLLGVAS